MVKFFREMFKRFPGLFIANILLLLISGGLESLTLLTLVPVMDVLSHAHLSAAGPVTRHVLPAMNRLGFSPTLLHLLILLLLFQVSASVLSVLATRSIFRTKYAVVRELLVDAFDDFFSASWYFFSSHSQGTLLNTFSRAVVQVGDSFGGIGLMFIAVARLIAYGIVPLAISWKITLFCAALAGLLAWPFLMLGKTAYRLGKVNMDTANETMGILHASLGGAKVILGYGNEKKSSAALRAAFEKHCRSTITFQTLTNAIPAFYKSLGLGVLAATLLVSQRMGISLAEISVMMLAFLQMVPLVGQLVGNKINLENLLPAYEQITRLREEAKAMEQRSGQKMFSAFSRELAVQEVSFSYPNRTPILRNISFVVPQGKFVAIVGESGAGKSTLIDLVMALHEPTRGRIMIDGISLQEFDVHSYRQRVGYVPQEAVLFNQSIRDNLLWAFPTANQHEIEEACRRANAMEFIEAFPEKFDTVVGDRGVRLSGGQAQRISLARAILRKPLLLILDEATSALDSQSERIIQQAIESIAKETTIIAIAHRLSTIMKADHIVLLQNGMIVEEGAYSALVGRKGLFHRMVELQMLTSGEH